MENLIFTLVVVFRTTHNISGLMDNINIGAVTLEKEGREFMLDPWRTTFRNLENGGTEMRVSDFENTDEAKEIWDDVNFDLQESDVLSQQLDTATLFLETDQGSKIDYDSDVESITLFAATKPKGLFDHATTVCIDLKPETFSLIA